MPRPSASASNRWDLRLFALGGVRSRLHGVHLAGNLAADRANPREKSPASTPWQMAYIITCINSKSVSSLRFYDPTFARNSLHSCRVTSTQVPHRDTALKDETAMLMPAVPASAHARKCKAPRR